MNRQRIETELSLIPFGNKGWQHSAQTPCIFDCDKWDKFGILFTQDKGIVRCLRCGESTSLQNYLFKIGRRDLVEGFSAPSENTLKSLRREDLIQDDITLKCELPRGYKRLYYDDYLEERGFTEYQYNLFGVGTSTDIRLREHIIYLIYQDNELVSWLGRTRYSKEWHKENIRLFKEERARLIPRYRNSDGTEFSEILGGSDEIIPTLTHTVILVEGLFDKANVDRLMNLYERNDTKCCYTFGKNLSEHQLKRLIDKGVENLILMYDPDALEEIEKFSLNYINKFQEIWCARLPIDIDPGDLTVIRLDEVMERLKQPVDFYFTNLKRI